MESHGFANHITFSIHNAIVTDKDTIEKWHNEAAESLTQFGQESRAKAVRDLAGTLIEHFAWLLEHTDDRLAKAAIRSAMREADFEEIADRLIEDIEIVWNKYDNK